MVGLAGAEADAGLEAFRRDVTDEDVDAEVEPGLVERVLDGGDDAGLAGAGGAVEDDDLAGLRLHADSVRSRRGASLGAAAGMLRVEGDAMPKFEFEREARTPHSESYAVEADGESVGRVDVHFVPGGPAHATLCVPEEYDDEEIQELIGEVDERIVLTAERGPARLYRDGMAGIVGRGVLGG